MYLSFDVFLLAWSSIASQLGPAGEPSRTPGDNPACGQLPSVLERGKEVTRGI